MLGGILTAMETSNTKRRFRVMWAGLAVLALVAAMACETESLDPADRAAVERTIDGYLHALADSYTNLDVAPLEEWASPNEIAAVHNLLSSLAMTGDRVESTLRGYHVDHIGVFRQLNATARLVEVWDVVRYDAFTGVEKGRTPDSIQNTLIQLRRIDGRWVVVGRAVVERETPLPEGGTESSQ